MSENVMNSAAAAPTIEIAAHAGTCYGVQRALDMALAAAPQAGESSQVHTLGPLIHNPIVVRELADAGVGLAETLDDAASGTVIIRAHGVVPQVIDAARERGLYVVDATCPYVKKVHVAAERLVREGYRVIVVGEPGHPEVEGILGHAGDDAQVVSCAADAAQGQGGAGRADHPDRSKPRRGRGLHHPTRARTARDQHHLRRHERAPACSCVTSPTL